MSDIVLASNSPRRRELLSLLGFDFVADPADIDESQLSGESPPDYVSRLAWEKAQAIAARRSGLVIAADTIVVDGEELLGKPQDELDAWRMLLQLRGRTHQVYTGLAILDSRTGESFIDICRTDVPMRNYSEDEIEAYIASGDPMDKAGAYAIQHAGFHPVEGLTGCFASVMGLPLCHLVVGLQQFGFSIPEDLGIRCQAVFNYVCPALEAILGQA